MSVRRSVTLTMSAGVQPAAFRTASMFESMRRVGASRPSSSSPVSGSRPVCPVRNTRSPVRIACECVPIDGGAAFVAILVLLGIRDFSGLVRQDYINLVNLVQSFNYVHGFIFDQSHWPCALGQSFSSHNFR